MDLDAWLSTALDAYDKGETLPEVLQEEEEEEEEDLQPFITNRNDRKPQGRPRVKGVNGRRTHEGRSGEKRRKNLSFPPSGDAPGHRTNHRGNVKGQQNTHDAPDPFKNFVEIKIKRDNMRSPTSSEDSNILSDDASVGLMGESDTASDHATGLEDTNAGSDVKKRRKRTCGRERSVKNNPGKQRKREKGERHLASTGNSDSTSHQDTSLEDTDAEPEMKKGGQGRYGKGRKTKNKKGKTGKRRRKGHNFAFTGIATAQKKNRMLGEWNRGHQGRRKHTNLNMTDKVHLPAWRLGKAGELSETFEYRFLGVRLEPTIGFLGHPATERMMNRTRQMHSPATRMRRHKEWMKRLVDEMEERGDTGCGRDEQEVDDLDEEEKEDEEEEIEEEEET